MQYKTCGRLATGGADHRPMPVQGISKGEHMKIDRRDFLKTSAAGAAFLSAGILPAAAQKPKTIVFGGSIPMSGKEADTGLNVLQGYKVAIQYINEKLGGVKIGEELYQLKLQMFDDASDPQRATTLVQKQVDDGVNFFLGSFSSAIVLPSAAITERAKRITVQAGGGSDQIFNRHYKFMFGMFPRASRQLVSLVAMMKSLNGGIKSCSLVTTNDSYSKTQADGTVAALKDAGIELKNVYRLPPTANDVSGVVSQIGGAVPDALVCTTHEHESALIAQQLASTGTNIKLLFMALGPESKAFRDNLGKLGEGITNIQYWEPSFHFSDPIFGSSQDYYKYYTSVSKRHASYQTVAASACIVSYVRAMQEAGGLDTEKVRDKLAALDYESVYGRIKFTKDGDGDPVLMGPAIGQIQNGNIAVVFPEKVATAKLLFPKPKW
jgi:branched-chain amino acid transport system substrate-binding protein